MRIKPIKELLNELYIRGIYDGIDITKGSRDRFLGNKESRKKWEKENLEMAYKELKRLLK